jgi:SAM-dependent methyltransferase
LERLSTEESFLDKDPERTARGSHNDRVAIVRDLLSQLPPGRLLDLGAGHGTFALVARELGWEVTAVDARTTRMPSTKDVEWVQADVREFPIRGYDVVTVLGLLYHLELEAQLSLLRRCHPALTLIDTHISTKPKAIVDGYFGHYFEERQEDLRASWGNPVSFWPTEESLCRMLFEAGFFGIYKVEPPPVTANRTLYVACAKSHRGLDVAFDKFNSASSYSIREHMVGVRLQSAERSRAGACDDSCELREERDAATSALVRLRFRRSVRIGLRLAMFARPLYRWADRRRGG